MFWWIVIVTFVITDNNYFVGITAKIIYNTEYCYYVVFRILHGIVMDTSHKGKAHPMTCLCHRGEAAVQLQPIPNLGTRRWWVVTTTPLPFTPGKHRVPVVQKAGRASGLVWTGTEKISLPPGFDPGNAQPVASRYTNYALPGPLLY